ncbi:hypothetical protein [Arthrobacter sp. SDTb3-6]|uniref:hypothetical protein n=1 Tax=Arthrobacter sp. SDTb3-6 TaxID=2713571 RepID=UPI00159E9D44|nr:hypothetical protein [Arthrobacter sp. SDTb3-6]NVM98486.1 hypothetical protein [Arthrobacter sp. SDTb3-6]
MTTKHSTEATEPATANEYAITPQLSGWSPKPLTRNQWLDPWPLGALAATLGIEPPASTNVPPLWHWLYFLDWTPAAELGNDGHPTAGDFLPPLRLRTRMFAGGRYKQLKPLRTGMDTERSATVIRTQVKNGRSGEMLFVVLRHEFHQLGELCVVEEQDIVYRSGPVHRGSPPAAITPAGPAGGVAGVAPAASAFTPEATTLFRFSALTGNAHRIHYDADYAREKERYERLVIHGPLQILLMMREGLSGRAPSSLASANYRLLRPAHLGDELSLSSRDTPTGVDVQLFAAGRRPASATASLTFR